MDTDISNKDLENKIQSEEPNENSTTNLSENSPATKTCNEDEEPTVEITSDMLKTNFEDQFQSVPAIAGIEDQFQSVPATAGIEDQFKSVPGTSGIKDQFKSVPATAGIEDQFQSVPATAGNTATYNVETLSATDNVVKAEEKMDTEPPEVKKDSAEEIERMSSQDTVVLPIDVGTPKTNDKKARGRPSSESSQTPPANKIAKLTPRATRSSQNPDFAAKQRKFLNRVHDPIRSINNNSDSENSQGSPAVSKGSNRHRSAERKTPVSSDLKKKFDKESGSKRPAADSDEEGSVKKRKTREPTKVVGGVDSYCWRCHRDRTEIRCDCRPCPRVYHVKCVQLDNPPDHPWMCPECSLVTEHEDTGTRSRAMKMLTLDQLCNLLRFALNRMKNHEGAEDFLKPVDPVQFPQYREYIVKPMDLSQLERNIKARLYGSTEAFLADAKWIVHNSIIFNSVQSKFTNTARALLKLCRQEMQHIENCPDCYLNSHTRSSDSWFTEACRRPHILVWAKLKGFPFWPAKVMSVNSENNQVDVRFFGAHDRAWIPLSQCYLFSKLSPTPTTNNKNKRNLEECLQELECHIKKLRDKFGLFEYAPYKTPYDPKKEDSHLNTMLPQYESKIVGKRSRLSLHHDGARKSLGRRTVSPMRTPEKPASEETPANSTPTIPNGIPGAESPSKEGDQPMVFIPGKSKAPAPLHSNSPVKTPTRTMSHKQVESDVDRTPTIKPNSTPVLKKKTPLTAAAKKCFATDKVCAKCNSRTTTVNADSLCSVCSKLDDKRGVHFKKDERGGDLNSAEKETVTVPRKRAIIGEGDQAGEEVTEPSDLPTKHIPETGQSETGQRKSESEHTESTKEIGDGNGSIESPPKFVIHKGLDSDTPEPAKKISIVDRLQEKLCFTVIEALKDQLTPEEVQAIETAKEVDSSPEKISEVTIPSQDSTSAVVVLHDLKNDKEMMDKFKESDANVTSGKDKDDETHSPSEIASEVETDVSCSGDSDTVITQESKQRKKKNINNVVQNLKERKSSVDERSEQGKKSNMKEPNTLMLDDSVEESSILIIDEGESSDSKKSSGGKSDKSRRKGIPAKVHSRSSTSTESCDDNRLTKSRSVEVLDEASGHFRRSSGEKDRPVTITVGLVTEDDKPQKKARKEIRSVNISKSLSLSVIKDSAGLEMECAESDNDEPVFVDSVRTVPPRPTARKTLPNPPRLANVDKRPASVPPPGSPHPPPLVSLRQSKPLTSWAPMKTPPSPAPPPRIVLPPVKPSPRADVGPVHAKLEDVVQKVVTFVRSTFEEMLKVSTEVTGENAEALRQLHQLEIEKLKWQHKQELVELKHNTDLVVMEIRACVDADKQRSLLDLKHKCEVEKEQALSETKRRQWCAFCQNEAQLYCCWNTAYCSYICQQEHWAPHMGECRNKQQNPEDEVVLHRPGPGSGPGPAFPQVGYNS